MGVEENRYRAPEAEVVKRPVRQPRPFLRFLAGAVCIGATVPFGLLFLVGLRYFVEAASEKGWLYFLGRTYDRWMVLFTLMNAIAAFSFSWSGLSFLSRRVRPGRRIPIISAISGMIVVWLANIKF